MKEFPEFMRNEKNAIDSLSQSDGVKGYVYDGVDGSQMGRSGHIRADAVRTRRSP